MDEQKENDKRAIRQLVETWMSATRAGDLPTLTSLMADDVVFTVPGREPFGKEVFAAASEGMKGMQFDGRSEILEIEIANDWAWMRNRLRVVVTPQNGKPIVRSGYMLTILRRNPEGRWVIARDANLLTQEPEQ